MTRSIKNLIAAVLISISGYLTWTQIVPAFLVKDFLEQKIEEKRATITSRTDIIGKIEKIRAELGTKYSELQRLSLVAPQEKGLAEIISAVEGIYAQSGVVLPEMTLNNQNNSQGSFNEIFFETRNEATYRQVINLLSFLEKNIRILDLNSISIGLSPEARRDSQPDPELSLLLKGKFYWLKSTEASSIKRPVIDRGDEE